MARNLAVVIATLLTSVVLMNQAMWDWLAHIDRD
jgi:hypothetical protein